MLFCLLQDSVQTLYPHFSPRVDLMWSASDFNLPFSKLTMQVTMAIWQYSELTWTIPVRLRSLGYKLKVGLRADFAQWEQPLQGAFLLFSHWFMSQSEGSWAFFISSAFHSIESELAWKWLVGIQEDFVVGGLHLVCVCVCVFVHSADSRGEAGEFLMPSVCCLLVWQHFRGIK